LVVIRNYFGNGIHPMVYTHYKKVRCSL